MMDLPIPNKRLASRKQHYRKSFRDAQKARVARNAVSDYFRIADKMTQSLFVSGVSWAFNFASARRPN
jgi:hypothetical protein